ncbi:thioredoxin family protein [Peloplasma aerotolerans]|uniref:Thioredoxin family protein n=1 Tax=Peloplasma aerotolerans TaxID=3044389 RepID=A0AAW6UAI2_9MOLU|nr:thioredoxin family protein [Mariniplasma sp. M4Ah]MDI6453198.1 thioredoxin family protein [Mariniplasma sp. M4Ah]MDR4968114.1 thioredoxin family protein [Acholeplasmataceae bacterium]
MEIKVLGSGCSNCKKLLQIVEDTVKALDVKANIIYVTDMIEIANTGLLRTPGLIINDKIVSYGRVPSSEEVKTIIQNIK